MVSGLKQPTNQPADRLFLSRPISSLLPKLLLLLRLLGQEIKIPEENEEGESFSLAPGLSGQQEKQEDYQWPHSLEEYYYLPTT